MRSSVLPNLFGFLASLDCSMCVLSRRLISLKHPLAVSQVLPFHQKRSQVLATASDRPYVDLGVRSGGGIDFKEMVRKGKDATYYEKLRDDRDRTDAYRNAISMLAKGKVVADIGTGSLALLAIFCAEAGAAHVYAIEGNPQAAASARKCVENAGLTERITVLEEFSTSLSELPQAVDLIVHDVIGQIASCEGVAVIIEDAKRFLKPLSLRTKLPWSIPARVETLVAPITNDRGFWKTNVDQPWQACMSVPDSVLLGDWQVCEDFVFGGPSWQDVESPLPSIEDRILSWRMERAGIFGGFVLCIRGHALPPGNGAPFTSLAAESHWDKVIVVFDKCDVNPGDTISLRTAADLRDLKPRYLYHALLEPAPCREPPRSLLELVDIFDDMRESSETKSSDL